MIVNSLLALLLVTATGFAMPDVIKDIRQLPQDHLFYVQGFPSDEALVPARVQEEMDARYNGAFFSPWHREKPLYPIDSLTWEFDKYSQSPGFGENARPRLPSWIKALLNDAQLDLYPNARLRAITISNTDLRVLPTQKPYFSRCDPSGRCSTFDKFQQSGVAAGTPLYITQISRDKAWVLVETGYTYGWLPANDVAIVDEAFVKIWEGGSYAVIIKDKVPLYDDQGRYLVTMPLGLMMPKVAEDSQTVTVLVAVSDQDRKAVMKRSVVSKDAAVPKPLALKRFNLAKLANELVNEPYGWGGMYQNRDCSALVMDFFAPFGIWLPRHSSHQALQGGTYVDLSKMTPKEKERIILDQGVPYLTLLSMRGHIMLYIGSYQGKPLVFHNFWFAKTEGSRGKQNRQIVGQAAITTLSPGSGLTVSTRARRGFLPGLQGMTLLIPKTEKSR